MRSEKQEAGRKSLSCLRLNIFAVTDAIDSNRAAFSIDFIDNSVITNPKTIAGYRTFEFFASGRKGGFPSGSGLQP